MPTVTCDTQAEWDAVYLIRIRDPALALRPSLPRPAAADELAALEPVIASRYQLEEPCEVMRARKPIGGRGPARR